MVHFVYDTRYLLNGALFGRLLLKPEHTSPVMVQNDNIRSPHCIELLDNPIYLIPFPILPMSGIVHVISKKFELLYNQLAATRINSMR